MLDTELVKEPIGGRVRLEWGWANATWQTVALFVVGFWGAVFTGTPATRAYQVDTDEVLKIASLVDDCDASFHAMRFPHLWQCWNSCRGFESERFSSFTAKLAETCPDYLLRIERLNGLAESTQSLHLFVTVPTDEAKLQFLLVARSGSPVDGDDATLVADLVLRGLRGVMFSMWGEMHPPLFNQPLCAVTTENWWVVGTDNQQVAACVDSLLTPFAAMTVSGLARDRRFARALTDSKRDDCDFLCFFRPSRFPSFFEMLDDLPTTHQARQLEELPTGFAYGRVALEPTRAEISGAILHTLPGVGIAEVWQARKPVPKLPRTPFDWIGITAEYWNPGRTTDVLKVMADEAHGPGSFNSIFQAASEETGLSGDVIHEMHDGIITIQTGDSPLAPRFISMKSINQPEFSEAWFRYLVAQNGNKGFGRLDSPPGTQLYGYSDDAYERIKQERKSQLTSIPYKSTLAHIEKMLPRGEGTSFEAWLDEVASILEANESIMLTPEWILEGHAPDLIRQFEHMAAVESLTVQESPINGLQAALENATAKARLSTRPYFACFEKKPFPIRDFCRDHFSIWLVVPELEVSIAEFLALMASSDDDPTTRQRSEELFKEATMIHAVFSIETLVETLDYRTALYSKNENNGIGFFFSLESRSDN